MAGRSRRRKKSSGKYHILLLLALVCLCVIGKREYEIYRIKRDEQATRERIAELNKQKAALEKERKLLDDPRYIEQLARDGYNMVGKNEVPVFIIDPDEANKAK